MGAKGTGKRRALTALAVAMVAVACFMAAVGFGRAQAWADEGSREDTSLVKEYLAGHISADYVDSGLWGSLVAAVSGENGLAADGLTDTGFTVDVTQLWTNSFLMDDDVDVAAYIEEEGAVLTVYAHTVPVYDFGSDEWVAALVDMTRINGASKLCAAILCDTEGVVADVENGVLYLPKDAVGEDKERPFCRVVLPYSGLEEAEVEVTVDGEAVDVLSFDVLQGSMSMELSADDEGEDISLDNVTLSVDGNEVDDEEGSLVFYDEDEEVLTLMASPTTMASLDVSAASYAPVSFAAVSVTNGTITFENGGTATVSNGVIRGTCTVRGNGFDYNIRLSYFGTVTMPDGQVLPLKCAEEYLGNADHIKYVAPVDGTYPFRTIASGDSYIVIIESSGRTPVLPDWPTQRLMTTVPWTPKEATGAISVIKTVSEAATYNTKVNRQATFGFWTNSSCSGAPEFTLTTDPNTGTASRSGRKVGTTYYVKETSCPTGTTRTTAIKSAMIAANSTVSVSFNNSLIRGGISGTKADSATGATPSGDSTFVGSTFVIKYTGSGKVRPFSTTSSGANGTVKDLTGGRSVSSGTDVMSVTVTDATGAWSTGAKALPTGTYEVRETVTDNGHTVNTGWKKTVTIDTDGGVKGTGTCSNTPTDIDLKIVKLANGTKVPLKGATYDLVNVSANKVVWNGKTFATTTKELCESREYPEGAVMATVTTQEDGTVTVKDLPYGTYRLVETDAPDWYAVESSSVEVSTSKAIDGKTLPSGGFYTESYKDGTLTVEWTNRRGRGDLLLPKVDDDGNAMPKVAFLLINHTTQEAHVVVTDANGYIRTAVEPKNPNGNDSVLEGVELVGGKIPYDKVKDGDTWEIADGAQIDWNATVWFSTDDPTTASATAGALQFGTYEAVELAYKGSDDNEAHRGETNFGHRLHDFTFTLGPSAGVGEVPVVDKVSDEFGDLVGQITDDGVEMRTRAHDERDRDLSHDDSQVVFEFDHALVVDEVDTTGVREGDNWSITTVVMDKRTNKRARREDGTSVVQRQKVDPSFKYQTVEIDTYGLAQGTYVVTEFIYDDDTGRLVSDHSDLDDEDQTFVIHKATVATEAWGDSHDKKVAAPFKDMTLKDDVAVTSTTGEVNWFCAGVCVDKAVWDRKVTDADAAYAEALGYIEAMVAGKDAKAPEWVVGFARNGAQDYAGSTTGLVTYTGLDLEGRTNHDLVFFEVMFRTSKYDGVPDQAIGSHMDIDDEGQTVVVVPPSSDMPMTGSGRLLLTAGCALAVLLAAGATIVALNWRRARG